MERLTITVEGEDLTPPRGEWDADALQNLFYGISDGQVDAEIVSVKKVDLETS